MSSVSFLTIASENPSIILYLRTNTENHIVTEKPAFRVDYAERMEWIKITNEK